MGLPERPRVLITGVGSGLGRALALALAEREARVFGTDTGTETLDATGAAVQAAGGEWHGEVADTGSWDDWQRVGRSVEQRWGGLDLLVNNAGVALAGRVGEVSIEDWRWLMDINLWGVIYGCHVFAPIMREQKGGSILNVSSAAGFASAPELAPYNVSKAGVISLTETLYGELQAAGVHASVLCPTFFRSELPSRTRATTDKLMRLTNRLVTNSKWTPEKIAKVALRGLEKKELFILPQNDAKLLYAMKRSLGPRFPDFLAWYRKRL